MQKSSDSMDEELSLGEFFARQFDAYAEYVYRWACGKGWWEEGDKRNKAELIALMHSELSEALEGLRHGNPPDDKIPEFSALEAELADTIIRIMDMAAAFRLRVGSAIVAKMEYNESRAHKHGGKEF